MAVIPIERTQSLDDIIREEPLDGVMFTGEKNAHRFVITCTRKGVAQRMHGLVSARFMRMAGPSYYVEGEIDSSGAVCVTLDARCYQAPGTFRLTIFVTDDDDQTVVYAAKGEVLISETLPVIDTTGRYPTSIEQMVVMLQNLGVDVMKGATSSKDGSVGTVPKPMAGDQNKYLAGSGTWKAFSNATQSAAGYMSASDKKKLDGIEANATAYVHPVYTPLTGKPTAAAAPAFGNTFTVSQITTDSTGHVTGMTDRVITIPGTLATTSAAGIVKASQAAVDRNAQDESDLIEAMESGPEPCVAQTIVSNSGVMTVQVPFATYATAGAVMIQADKGLEFGVLEDIIVEGGGISSGGSSGESVAQPGWLRASEMQGATASNNGKFGAPPAPQRGDQGKFLRGDATWADPPAYTLPRANQSTLGGVTLSGVAESDNTVLGLIQNGYYVLINGTSDTNRLYAVIPKWDTAGANTTAALMTAAQKAKLDSFGAASTYALKSDLTAVYKYKGSKASVSALPSSGNTQGDVWDVSETGMNYAWNGSAWDALGTIYTPDIITDAAVDAICV